MTRHTFTLLEEQRAQLERILLKDVARVRILDVRLESDQSVLAGLLKNIVEDLQQLGVSLLVVWISFEQPDHLLHARRHNAHRVADQKRTDRRATNNDEFGPLHQHANVPMMHRVSEQDAAKNDDDSDDDEHE